MEVVKIPSIPSENGSISKAKSSDSKTNKFDKILNTAEKKDEDNNKISDNNLNSENRKVEDKDDDDSEENDDKKKKTDADKENYSLQQLINCLNDFKTIQYDNGNSSLDDDILKGILMSKSSLTKSDAKSAQKNITIDSNTKDSEISLSEKEKKILTSILEQKDIKSESAKLSNNAKGNATVEISLSELEQKKTKTQSAKLNNDAKGNVTADMLKLNQDNMKNDIAKDIKYMLVNNIKDLKVKVEPKGSGEVELKIVSENGQKKIEISSNNKNTENIIKSSLHELNGMADFKDVLRKYNAKEATYNNMSDSQGTSDKAQETSSQLKNVKDNVIASSEKKDDQILNKVLSSNDSKSETNFNLNGFTNNINKVEVKGTAANENLLSLNKETLASDIIKDVKYMQVNDIKNLTVKVNPKELGEIEIKLTFQNDQMKLDISSNNAKTVQMLNKNLDELNSSINMNNISVQNFSVNIFNSNSDQHNGSFDQHKGNHKKSNQKDFIEALNEDENTLENEDTLSNVNILA